MKPETVLEGFYMGNGKTFSIRVTVLSTFFIISTLIASLALGLQYYFSIELAKDAAWNHFEDKSADVGQKLAELDAQSGQVVEMLVHLNSLEHFPGFENDYEELELIVSGLKRSEGLYSYYMGYDNGDFFEVINLSSGESVRRLLGAKSEDEWMVSSISTHDGKRVKVSKFYDSKLALRAMVKKNTDYDPRTRPWFTAAVKSAGAVRTEPYLFSTMKVMGITYAKAQNHGARVAGVDISLESLQHFMHRQAMVPESEMVMFRGDGVVTAYIKEGDKDANTSIERVDNPYLMQFIEQDTSKSMHMEVDKDGEKNLVYVERFFPKYGPPTYMGFMVSQTAILAPYMEKIRYALLFTIVLMLLLVPIVLWFASLIVRPIKMLVVENKKVEERRWDDVTKVESNITEILELSCSMVEMSLSLKAYEVAQREMMDSFIKLIAGAIDQKSPYTGGHCARVPVVAEMLARAASNARQGPLADFAFTTDDQWREFNVAAWLHDCGKVTTPEYIVDKGSKLETIYNRIHEVRTRFEVLLRDAQIEFWQGMAQDKPDEKTLRAALLEKQEQIKGDFAFVAACNVGGEYMAPERVERLESIAQITWTRHLDDRIGLSPVEELRLDGKPCQAPPCQEFLLADKPEHVIPRPPGQGLNDGLKKGARRFDMPEPEHMFNFGEVYNLSISRGTLTEEDRYIIKEHVVMSIKMLEMLPYPENLTNVPEFAGAHHETLVGTGYPRKLRAEEMSIPARIMALADIYEALTAGDRPYKKAKKVSETLKIMSFMVKDQHVDKDLFELFLRSGVYLDYAKKYLKPEQIDEVDLGVYLG